MRPPPPTLAILQALRAQARPCCADCADQVGADEAPSLPELLAGYADDTARRISAALDQVASLPGNAASAGMAWVRGELLAAERDLLEAAQVAVQGGADMSGVLLGALAERARQALGALGAGAGDAFRAFWGISPSTASAGAALLAAGVLLALALSPGGQAALPGTAQALARSLPMLAR